MGKMSAMSVPKCSTWQCENDAVKLVLCHDVVEAGSYVSSTLYGDVAKNQELAADFAVFSKLLKEKGVEMVNIKDLVSIDAPDSLMTKLIKCEVLDKSITTKEVDDFKSLIIRGMSADKKAHATTHIIKFKLVRGIDNAVMAQSYTITPVVDLLDSRLQIVTPAGIVLSGAEEQPEKVRILSHAFTKMGLPIILSLPSPLKLHGGDYIPAGPELCFIGTGLNTDNATVRYMLAKKVFGASRVAVVRDLFDRSEERGNLDAVFKIIDKDTVIMLDSIIGAENPKRRLVSEYTLHKNKYEMSRMDVELSKYLEELGFNIIRLPESLYGNGIGIVNIGEGHLIVNNPELATLITSESGFKGKVEVIDCKWDSAMYRTLMKSTLVFRHTTPTAHHTFPKVHGYKRPWAPKLGGEGAKPSQTTNQVLMVSPVGFCTNPQTAEDNHFMNKSEMSPYEIEKKALVEFSGVVAELTKAGVTPVIFANERWYNTPDAVFPNNWFSTHAPTETNTGESTVVFYPMKTESRRKERREYIISEMQQVYSRELSLAQWEYSDFPQFLESTGVLIMDRVNMVCYMALSQRANKQIAETWAERLGYKMIMFHATDAFGNPIYHTNVLMSVGTKVAVICLESIEDKDEKEKVISTLSRTHEIVDITRAQMGELCGNVLEVHGEPHKNRIMCMSTRAYN
eukprot:Ihof_evm5s143 gene=Ihof_evmTU5s143